jgi:Uma2 family endonuclease
MSGLQATKVRLFTPDEVPRRVGAGILGEDEPVELVEGRPVVVSPQGPIPSSPVGGLAERPRAAYGPGFTARADKPLQLAGGLPEPDVAVVRGGPLDYRARYPVPADVVLVVEAAVTSRRLDRRKARGYARGGVANEA